MDWIYVYFIGGFVAVAVVSAFDDKQNIKTYGDLLCVLSAKAIVFALSWFALLMFALSKMHDAGFFDKEVFWRK
tara:strand:- start:295 stop:516 length:222 start_codon:yes stop_codon:yes gene_type:complete